MTSHDVTEAARSDQLRYPREFGSDFVHLARLALAGRPQDAAAFVRNTARRCRGEHPSFADELIALLRENPNAATPVRGASLAPAPVDTESRLPLLNVVHQGSLAERPILAAHIFAAVQQVIVERLEADRLLEADLSPAHSVLFAGPPAWARRWPPGGLLINCRCRW
ncbi:hypothetical protein ACWDUL_20690 [Nocardia niigatensis]